MTPGSPSWPGRPDWPLGRLVNKHDFERLLAARSRGRSAHFALHHLDAPPTVRLKAPAGPVAGKLSTVAVPTLAQPVDKPRQVWFGCVVPKRHARRAVTRNQLKRQVRGAFQRFGEVLPAGLWLVRLRSPFSSTDFISARSAALAHAARAELDGLLAQAAA